MPLEDWRDADAMVVDDLYAQERRRWLDDLSWDTPAAWAIVEEGRARGTVPGWILRDSRGVVRGWAYYVLFDGELQIGGLTAKRAIDFRELVDGVLASPEASLATTLSCFVYPAPGSLVSALRRRRFAVRRSLYLARPLSAQDGAGPAPRADLRVRAFRESDLLGAVRLLAAAYEGAPGAVSFAPHGRLDEWVRYVRQLMDTHGCGRFLADASFAAEDPATGRLVGLVLTTSLALETAHVAQVVVGPLSE